jgi:hypothetical protein
VGARFNTETVKNIHAANFNEQIVGKIANPKEPTRLDEFLTAVGPEGKQLAEAALLSKIPRKGIDGEISAKDFEKWSDTYRTHLEMLPELKASTNSLREFTSKAKQVMDEEQLAMQNRTMDNIRQEINGEKNVLMRDVLSASSKGQAYPKFDDTSKLVSKFISDPVFTRDVMRQYGDKPEFIKAIQNSMLLEVMKTSTPMTGLAQLAKDNPMLKGAVGEYQKGLGKVFALMENLQDIKPIGNPLNAQPKDALEAAAGISKGDLAAKYSATIGSQFNRLARTLRTAFGGKQKQAQVALIQRMVSDPLELPKMIRAMEQIKAPKADDLVKSEAGKYIAEALETAKNSFSKDPAISGPAKDKLWNVAKKAVVESTKAGIPGTPSVQTAQRVLTSQTAREDLVSKEDKQEQFKRSMLNVLGE